ncbi:hypothetical protein TNCV_4874991 [Trichonephila clavipes]|nr:hypothetical protein TNCV_4874991 [Trichonephila clavipes]
MPIVHSEGFGELPYKDPTRQELLPSGSRNILLILGTSTGLLNPQTLTFLSTSNMPCTMLFRRDLDHLVLQWISGLSIRNHGMNCLQDTILVESERLAISILVLRPFCRLTETLYGTL